MHRQQQPHSQLYYDEIQKTISDQPLNATVELMGDMHAKIGKSQNANGSTGKFGFGRQNERGERLVQFCEINQETITNTFLKQSNSNRLWTRKSPGSRYRNQIDYIMISSKWKSSVTSSRVFPSADIGSDHQLVSANLRCKLKNLVNQQTSWKHDVTELADHSVRDMFKCELLQKYGDARNSANNSVEGIWKSVKDAINETAVAILG